MLFRSISFEDPSLRAFTDPESGQTRLAGMGVLHLEVAVDKLARDHPDAILRAALHEWDRRTDCDRPEFLPTVLGDVVKRSRAAPSTIGKPTQKALGWEQAGAELLAEMEGPQ